MCDENSRREEKEQRENHQRAGGLPRNEKPYVNPEAEADFETIREALDRHVCLYWANSGTQTAGLVFDVPGWDEPVDAVFTCQYPDAIQIAADFPIDWDHGTKSIADRLQRQVGLVKIDKFTASMTVTAASGYAGPESADAIVSLVCRQMMHLLSEADFGFLVGKSKKKSRTAMAREALKAGDGHHLR